MHTFISGLTSFLTPSIFPLFIAIPIIFEKFGNSLEKRRNNIIAFAVFTITIFLSKSLSLLLHNDLSFSNYNFYLDLIVDLLQVLFFIYFIVLVLKRPKKLNNKLWLRALSILGIGILSYELAQRSLGNSGPILGEVLISESFQEELYYSFWLCFTFSLGLILPFVLILFVAENYYKKMSSKKWWKIIQVCTVGWLFITAMINALYFIMILNTTNLP